MDLGRCHGTCLRAQEERDREQREKVEKAIEENKKRKAKEREEGREGTQPERRTGAHLSVTHGEGGKGMAFKTSEHTEYRKKR
jgi:hypothetical protein